MNVSKLARQLNVSTKELLEILPGLGFAIGQRAIKIDDRQVDRIMAAWRQRERLLNIKHQHEQIAERRSKQEGKGEANRQIQISEHIIVKDLAEMMGLPLPKLMAEMMKNGIMASLNERLDYETASIIAEDLGYQVSRQEAAEEGDVVSHKEQIEKILAERENSATRPPVVVVMGHVDHGKTKLLDAIRKTNIMAGEAGGITQHIGAYQTVITKEGKTRTITFLDTPGHEAFKAMRSRGGQVADVAILVVAADDGLQPQTLESLAIIQKEKLPFVVAINKIDKPEADIERVKKELSEVNLLPEDWGGKTICVLIEAKQGEHIEELLDMVLLVADMLELQADPDGPAVGTIIESHMDKFEGPVATVLIQAGTLRVNDLVTVGAIVGKIKALKTWTGENTLQAIPGMPVRILGLKGVGQVGDILQMTKDRKSFKKLLKQAPGKQAQMHNGPSLTANQEIGEDKEIPTINIVLRADVLGSLEAIEAALDQLSSAKARVKIIKQGLGFITEGDIQSAETAGAILITFNLKTPRQAEVMAQEKKVEILQYDIIYKLLEEIQQRLKNMARPEIVRTLIGRLTVLAVFKTSGKETILGGKVIEGKVINPCKVKVLRGENIITYGSLTDLESNREKMTEIVKGNEIGMKFIGEPVVRKDDILEFFTEEDVSQNR